MKNSTGLAIVVTLAAFAIRLAYCSACYLNPDEAAHYASAAAGGWIETYKAACILAHPPLFILVLHAVLALGRTELVARMPSLLAGTAAIWLTFAWIRRSLGGIAALAGLGFMALSPAAISASTEVRQYGLQLCFLCGALYASERVFEERGTKWVVVQGLFLLGALLTHYTTIVIMVSLNIYLVLRLFSAGAPRQLFMKLGVVQIFLVGVLVALYFAHVRRTIHFGIGSSMDYLGPYYYMSGRESELRYLWRAYSGTFSYAVGTHRLALLFMLLVPTGVVALMARGGGSRQTSCGSIRHRYLRSWRVWAPR